jgi:hypothetical protein
MTLELMPPSDGVPAAAEPPRVAAFVVGLAILAAVLFYSTLLFGGSLRGYDWESHHYHYFDWVRTSLTQFHTLPLFMNRAWITKNFLANAEAPSLGPLVPLLLVLPTDTYLKLLMVVFTAAGLTGMFLLLRDIRVGREIAGFVAIVFAFNGFFVSHLAVGHHWAMGAQLLPGLLCLYRRAALGSGRALWLAAALNACTILGGQHQPFIWQNLLISLFALAWSVRVRALFPLGRLVLLVLATAALGAVKLLPMLAEFADYDPTARIEGLPLRLVLSALIAGGQHPELAAPGVTYEHGSGWWEFAFYVGPVAFGCMVVGLIRVPPASCSWRCSPARSSPPSGCSGCGSGICPDGPADSPSSRWRSVPWWRWTSTSRAFPGSEPPWARRSPPGTTGRVPWWSGDRRSRRPSFASSSPTVSSIASGPCGASASHSRSDTERARRSGASTGCPPSRSAASSQSTCPPASATSS